MMLVNIAYARKDAMTMACMPNVHSSQCHHASNEKFGQLAGQSHNVGAGGDVLFTVGTKRGKSKHHCINALVGSTGNTACANLQVGEAGDISWGALAGNAQQLSMDKLLTLQS